MVGFGFIAPGNAIHNASLPNAHGCNKSGILSDFIGIFNLLLEVKLCSFKYLLCFSHAIQLEFVQQAV